MRLFWNWGLVGRWVYMEVGCPCPPNRNDIVTPVSLVPLFLSFLTKCNFNACLRVDKHDSSQHSNTGNDIVHYIWVGCVYDGLLAQWHYAVFWDMFTLSLGVFTLVFHDVNIDVFTLDLCDINLDMFMLDFYDMNLDMFTLVFFDMNNIHWISSLLPKGLIILSFFQTFVLFFFLCVFLS